MEPKTTKKRVSEGVKKNQERGGVVKKNQEKKKGWMRKKESIHTLEK